MLTGLLASADTALAWRTPSNIQASDGAYTNQVRVSWNGDAWTNNIWFYIYRNANCSGTPIGSKLEANANTGEFFDTGAIPTGIKHDYSVKWGTEGCSSERGSTGVNSGFRSPPTAPSWFSASEDDSTQVRLSWGASPSGPDNINYKVFRDNNLLYTTAGTSYNDTSAVPGTTYSYSVRSRSVLANGGESLSSTIFDNGKRLAVVSNYTLTVNKSPATGGTVISTIAGINCGTTCSHSYAANTFVPLSAAPASGYTFSSWSNCPSPVGGVCNVTMNSNKTVTANFTASSQPSAPSLSPITATCSGATVNPATLNWSGGTGPYSVGIKSGAISVPPSSNTPFWHTASSVSGTSVSSSQLNWWTGSADQTSNRLVLSPNATYSAWVWAGGSANLSNVVRFTTPSCVVTPPPPPPPPPPSATETLTVNTNGTGVGKVTSSPAGINCGNGGSSCSHLYNDYTAVTLTPTPATGSAFAGWSGSCTGTGTCNLTMHGDKTVTATFNLVSTPPPPPPPSDCNALDSGSWNVPAGTPSTLNNRPAPLNVSPQSQIKQAGGCIGIGITTPLPLAPLDINGDAFILGTLAVTAIQTGSLSVAGLPITGLTSDLRLKTGISPLSNMLSKILQLKPVSFQFKDQNKYGSGTKLGLVAQDVEKILPELVATSPTDGYQRVDYSGAIAPLIKAIQEQQVQIDELKQEIAELKAGR